MDLSRNQIITTKPLKKLNLRHLVKVFISNNPIFSYNVSRIKISTESVEKAYLNQNRGYRLNSFYGNDLSFLSKIETAQLENNENNL